MTASRVASGLWLIALAAAGIAGAATFNRWWPIAQRLADPSSSISSVAGDGSAHGHAHQDDDSIEVSPQALKSLGLNDETLRPVQLATYQQSITIPAVIVGRHGHSHLEASTPIAGIITHVHAVQGEALEAGAKLFELRITAEALVSSQMNLLKLLGELDVETREIARLSKAVETGAVASRNLLERQYAQEKLQSQVDAQKEGLRLVGLSDRQIEEVVSRRKLLKELIIVAPSHDVHSEDELQLVESPVRRTSFPAPGAEASVQEPRQPLIVKEVLAHKGETVAAGETLAVVTDNAELFIEGQAFEQDAHWLTEAVQKGWKATAVIPRPGGRSAVIEDLEFVYTASEIDPASRTLPVYVRLPNVIDRSVTTAKGQRFIDWRYRPGQRLQLQIPVEMWEGRFVLPAAAVARDGLDSYVFRRNGRKFDRVRVTVEHRDPETVVIADDQQIYPGNVIALRGAHQLQMALKTRSAGPVDPHSDHHH